MKIAKLISFLCRRMGLPYRRAARPSYSIFPFVRPSETGPSTIAPFEHFKSRNKNSRAVIFHAREISDLPKLELLAPWDSCRRKAIAEAAEIDECLSHPGSGALTGPLELNTQRNLNPMLSREIDGVIDDGLFCAEDLNMNTPEALTTESARLQVAIDAIVPYDIDSIDPSPFADSMGLDRKTVFAITSIDAHIVWQRHRYGYGMGYGLAFNEQDIDAFDQLMSASGSVAFMFSGTFISLPDKHINIVMTQDESASDIDMIMQLLEKYRSAPSGVHISATEVLDVVEDDEDDYEWDKKLIPMINMRKANAEAAELSKHIGATANDQESGAAARKKSARL